MGCKGVPRISHRGGDTEGGGVLWGRGSNLPPHQLGFLLFSALRMASLDTILLLIVDYHAAIAGTRPP